MDKEQELSNFENQLLEEGFGASESYYQTMEISIYEKLDILEELGTKEDGFTPDQQYLETLEVKVMEQIKPGLKFFNMLVRKSRQNTSNPAGIKMQISVAAVGVLLLCLPLFLEQKKSAQFSRADVQVSARETIAYVQENIYFLNDDDLELLLEDHIFDLEMEDNLSEEALMEYLILNDKKSYEKLYP